MPSRFARSITLGLLGSLVGTPALAQPPGETPPVSVESERSPSVRNEVVIGVTGALDPEARTTLLRLLRAELAPHELSLVERDPSGDARAWAREVAEEQRHLLAVLLDTRGQAGWRLVVIDAARGRAISRDLPRGERDAANVEAVVSIVVSATNALREGLEVASAPLESVVDPERARPTPPAPKPTPSPAKSEPSGATSLHGSVTALAASFADGAEPTFGASLALGVSVVSLVDIDARGTRHFPIAVDSAFGRFDLARTGLELSAGPVFRTKSFAFVPALGAAVEWIARTETRAAAGVTATDDTETIPRAGGLLAMRGRYRLLSTGDAELVSLMGGLSASYFAQSVKFQAGDELLAEARKSSFAAELGLFIATGSL